MTDSEEIEKWTENHKQAINMPLSTDLTLPNFAKKHLSEEQRKALDVGCGLGIPLNAFLSSGFTVTGVDQSKYAIDVCKERFPNLKFYCIRAQNINQIFTKEFDLAYTIAVLQHNLISRKKAIVEAIKHALKDDGLLLTAESCGSGEYPEEDDSYFHPYVLTKAGWIRFMGECGYKLVDSIPLNKDYGFLWKVMNDAKFR